MTSEPVSARSRKVVIAAIIVAAITPIVLLAISFLGDDATTLRYVITSGTRAALNEGKAVPNALPSSLALKVGDTLEIVNEDSEAHTYAFLVLRPGETARYTFRQVGTFTGECTVNDHDEVTITVSG
jgi:plastocyanin